MNEQLIQTNNCKSCQKGFFILPIEQTFYTKKNIPSPAKCPNCRQKERLSMRNENKLYKRACDKCQKRIISTYRPDSEYKVFCKDCFLSSLQ